MHEFLLDAWFLRIPRTQYEFSMDVKFMWDYTNRTTKFTNNRPGNYCVYSLNLHHSYQCSRKCWIIPKILVTLEEGILCIRSMGGGLDQFLEGNLYTAMVCIQEIFLSNMGLPPDTDSASMGVCIYEALWERYAIRLPICLHVNLYPTAQKKVHYLPTYYSLC